MGEGAKRKTGRVEVEGIVKADIAQPRPRRRAAPRPAPPGPPIRDPAALAAAAEQLKLLDPEVIGRLVEIGGPPPLRRSEPGFAGLAGIIVSQQVSVASADAIYGRLEKAVIPLEAPVLLAADESSLKICGLSAGKIRCLRALARAIVDEGLGLAELEHLSAETAHAALTAVHGIGPWTADIFLLFCLGHPDAFPVGDVALQEAAKLALGLRERPDAAKLLKIAERWRPFRGVAARMLWAYYREVKNRSGMRLAGDQPA